MNSLRFSSLRLVLSATALLLVLQCSLLNAATVRLSIQNVGPAGGTFVTPIFAGFHDGTYDLSNGGTATNGLELLAELGMTADLTNEFLGADPTRVAQTLGTAPIAPGATVEQDFVIDLAGGNNRLTLASMILPSSDFFIGNISTPAFDLSGLSSSTPLSFTLTSIYDAGTELNDFATSAGNPLLGLPPVDATLGVPDSLTNIRLVGNTPYDDYLNAPAGFAPSVSQFQVTVTSVPEPTTGLLGCILIGGVMMRRRKRKN